MILNKVVLNDFISHKNTNLAFGYGINVIIGPNGAGKTSILDAISFALFNDSSSRGKKENLINSKANKCKTTLEFTEKGILYSIDWIFERGKSPKGFLYKIQGNEKKFLIAQGGEKTLTPEVERILEMDQSMFAQSIYVKQGEIEELVNAKPADRKNLISKLLGVETLQKAWTEMRTVVDEFESTSDQLKGELSQKTTIEKEKQTQLDVVGDSETTFMKKTTELREIENKIANLQSVLQGLKESKKTYDKLDRQKSLVETEIHAAKEKLEKEQKELSHAMDAEAKVNSLKPEVEKLSFLEAYVSALTQKKQHDEQMRRLRDKIGTIDRLEQTVRENTEKHDVYLEKDGAIRQRNTERKKFEGAETALKQTLLSIQQVEKEEKKKQVELAKELAKWTQILGETTTVANFETLLELKRGNFQSIAEKLGAQVDILGKNIGGLENRRKELADSISKLEESTVEVTACPTCETELTAERLSQLLEKFHSQDEAAAKEMKQLAEELKKADENKKDAEDIFRKTSKLDEQKIKGLCSELGEMKSRLEDEGKRVEELRKQAEALKNLDTTISSLEEEKSRVTEGYQEFESARRELAKLPPRDRISDEMAPVVTALAIVEQNMREAVSNMGYESENPDKELASLRAKKQVYDQNIKLAGRRAEFEQSTKTIQTDLDSKRREFREIEASIKNLGYNEQEHGQKEADAENKNRQKSALKEAIAALDEKITHSKDEVTNCQRKLDTLKMKEKEKHSVDAFIQLLNRIRSAYSKDGVQKMIRGQARPMLERRTRDIFERFNLAYSDIRIDDDYNISVMGSGGEQDIDQISGGERVALAIALRLAIAQVLSEKVETIIMDEPTTHLDEERRRELVNILSSFFREEGRIIPQMLIITHHPEIENVADVIYTVTKENGYSQVQTGQTLDDS